MAYDEELADRVRAQLSNEPHVTERRMFGGLAFLVDGRMAVAVSSHGGLMVGVDPAAADELSATTAAEPVEMRGRLMRGWLRIASEHLASGDALATWVDRGRQGALKRG